MPIARSRVPQELKWDLTSLFPSEDAYVQEYASVKKKIAEIKKYAKKIDSDNLLTVLKLRSELYRSAENIYVYANLKKDVDTANAPRQAEAEKAGMLLTRVAAETAFIEPEMRARFPYKEDIKRFIARPEFKDFTTILEDFIREMPHVLPSGQEKIMAETGSFSGDFRSIFMLLDNADIKFGTFIVDGVRVEINHGSYMKLMQDRRPEVRRRAFKAYYRGYAAHINTLAGLYAASVKKDIFESRMRKYRSSLDAALSREQIPEIVLDNLLQSVKKALPFQHMYMRCRRKHLQLDEMHMYDLHFPMTDEYTLELEFEDAYALVKEALSPLGEEYVGVLDRARKERWIDVVANANKRSGAYSWGTYDSNPYVLLNYAKTAHDVFTIAHEMGHAMHSWYSSKAQCYEKADYPIFLAEIASTVNEVLLLKHLIKNSEGEKKRYLLNYYLDMFRTTFFRQTMFTEFELFAHEKAERGEGLDPETLSEKYAALNKEYYGRDVVRDKEIAMEWARVPHFYNAFYVYKYATGITVAVNIVNKLLSGEEGFAEKYIDFLSAGGSEPPIELLDKLGIRLRQKKPFNDFIEEMKTALEELKAL